MADLAEREHAPVDEVVLEDLSSEELQQLVLAERELVAMQQEEIDRQALLLRELKEPTKPPVEPQAECPKHLRRKLLRAGVVLVGIQTCAAIQKRAKGRAGGKISETTQALRAEYEHIGNQFTSIKERYAVLAGPRKYKDDPTPGTHVIDDPLGYSLEMDALSHQEIWVTFPPLDGTKIFMQVSNLDGEELERLAPFFDPAPDFDELNAGKRKDV